MTMEAMLDSNVKAVVRNIQNNDLYVHVDGNNFRNLRTGMVGNVSDEIAQKVFKINMPATLILAENPLVEELINKLNLKFDNNKK